MALQPYDEDSKHLRFVPLDEIATPVHGDLRCIIDGYWVVHPTRGAVFWRRVERTPTRDEWERGLAPQYNMDRRCAAALLRLYPWATIQRVPVALYRRDP